MRTINFVKKSLTFSMSLILFFFCKKILFFVDNDKTMIVEMKSVSKLLGDTRF